MLRKFAAALAASFLLFGFSACAPETTRFEAEFLTLFDTVTQIVAYAPDKETFTAQTQMIHDELEIYHRLYDIYNDYEGLNNLKTINNNAGKSPVTVDKKIVELLLLGREMYAKSGGKINVAMGSVLSIWHDYREAGVDDPENAELPPMEKLREAALHTDIGDMVIDEAASTVFLADPAMRLDVGSVGKGYAVEQVCLAARDAGFTSGLVSVGGNVRAIGSKDRRGTPWNVGVENPDGGTELLTIAYFSDKALVTSGVYQRYYTVGGIPYHHIIDPDTLMPAAYFKAVSILCPDSGMADALSTAVFNLPLEQGMALVSSVPDTQALWVSHDGSIVQSGGWAKAAGKR